jgi:hypothetical protein
MYCLYEAIERKNIGHLYKEQEIAYVIGPDVQRIREALM